MMNTKQIRRGKLPNSKPRLGVTPKVKSKFGCTWVGKTLVYNVNGFSLFFVGLEVERLSVIGGLKFLVAGGGWYLNFCGGFN